MLDKYELLDTILGRGHASVVHVCKSKEQEAVVRAVKLVEKTSSTTQRARIFQELDILKECENHPHILQLCDFYETDTDFRLVFEKLDGGTLFEQLRTRQRFTEREASLVTRDIADALSFIHKRGIAHRDLKPSNILCVRPDRVSDALTAVSPCVSG